MEITLTQDVMDFQLLDEISHIILRPDTYVGSLEHKEATLKLISEDGKVVEKNISYSPALLKIFDEIIQNCYDHKQRPAGKHISKIAVSIDRKYGEISVSDNGGIPVVEHPEHKMYVPHMIFGNLRSGSNYNDSDNRTGGGRNGLGSKLTNVFSEVFTVATADGKKSYRREYLNNMRESSDDVVGTSTKKYTMITFTPDYETLKTEMSDDNYSMLVNRVYEIAACLPDVEVILNKKPLHVKGFESFVKLFDETALFTSNESWRVGLCKSNNGLSHVSLINGTRTWLGGTHIDYVLDQIVSSVRELILKKTKQDVKPFEIKSHFNLFVEANVFNPKYNSQTKEHMTLPIKDYGTSYKIPDTFIKKLLKSDVIKQILEWAMDKKKLEEMKAIRAIEDENKKASFRDVLKYEPATEKNDRSKCSLFICEGDSAKNPLMACRDAKTQGIFTLRGKPLNLVDAKIEQIKKNKEIQDLMKILGLDFSGKETELRYGKIVLACDADLDAMHIIGLMLNNFNHKWKFVLKDKVFMMVTPVIRVTLKKSVLEFMTLEEYHTWLEANPKADIISMKYVKGLGSNNNKDFKKFMFDDKYIVPLRLEDDSDDNYLKIAFGPAKDKKTWLYPEYEG